MIRTLKNKITLNNILMTAGVIVVIFFNIIAYFLNNVTINKICFFIEGILFLTFLYKVIIYCIKKNKIYTSTSDLVIIILAIVVSFSIYFFLINTRNTIYVWDDTIYYNLMNDTIKNFNNSNLGGNIELVISSMTYDYGSFLLIFVYPFYCLFGSGIQQFIYSYFFACVVPVIICLYFFGKYIVENLLGKHHNKIISQVLIIISLIFFPLLHSASILGQPDIFGVVFCSIIILLTLNYNFLQRDLCRYLTLFVVTVCLVLTRRWYIFFILSYYVCYFVVLIVSQIFKRDKSVLKKSLINICIFGISSLIFGFAMLHKMIFMILGKSYSDSYVSWNKGGLWYEFINQAEFLGVFVSILVLLGLMYGFINSKLRMTTLIITTSYILEIVLFTRIQNMWYHQSLLLIITYIYAIICLIGYLIDNKIKILKFLPAFLIILSFINCSCISGDVKITDTLFSKIDIFPYQRTDLNNINKTIQYLNNNIKNEETVCVLAGGDDYDSSVFRNYPQVNGNKYIIQNSYYAASEGFPDDFLTSTYVISVNPLQQREQVENEAVLSTLVDIFNTNKYIKSKFQKMYTINLSSKCTADIYKRIGRVDEKEIGIFRESFKDYCDKYTEKFDKKLNISYYK